jgi:purine nucleosidase
MIKKVIIDCDVGVDDALALIFAFHSPELEVRAVTGVNGNVPLDLVFENIQRVLTLIRPVRKPWIARGSDRPCRGDPVYAYSFHGKDGLGEATIARRDGTDWWQTSSLRAHELITTSARQCPGEITLIAVGPLTNLALGLRQDPEGMRKLKEVVMMGGAVRTKGNITPHAEFNIFVDPWAAKAVFESGLPITLVPLDVTHQVFLTPQLIKERIEPMNNSFSQFLIEATGYDPTVQRFTRGYEAFHLHDPLAVGSTIDPELVQIERRFLQVEIGEGEHYGQTTEVRGGALEHQEIDVCFGVNSTRFLNLFLSRLSSEPDRFAHSSL